MRTRVAIYPAAECCTWWVGRGAVRSNSEKHGSGACVDRPSSAMPASDSEHASVPMSARAAAEEPSQCGQSAAARGWEASEVELHGHLYPARGTVISTELEKCLSWWRLGKE